MTWTRRLRQWLYVELADRGLVTDRQYDLAHREGVVQGAIGALRVLRLKGITRANVDRMEQNLLRQLEQVQRERLADIGLDPEETPSP